jgi:hypothetical protein
MEIKQFDSTHILEHKGDFKNFWKKLNSRRLQQVQDQIDVRNFSGKPASSTISALQNRSELAERWQAARAYNTETSRLNANELKDIAASKGIQKFKIKIESDACPFCVKETRNGNRIFTADQLDKGQFSWPPLHPNCHCELVLHTK